MLDVASLLARLLALDTHLLMRLLTLHAHLRTMELLALDALLPRSCIAAATAAMTTATAEGHRRRAAATTVAVTAASAVERRSSSTATTAATVTATAAATRLGGRRSASAIVRIATATAMATTGPRTCRGRNRQRGYTGGENQPGHCKNSFRTEKTVRSLHRSIGSTDGTCVLAH